MDQERAASAAWRSTPATCQRLTGHLRLSRQSLQSLDIYNFILILFSLVQLSPVSILFLLPFCGEIELCNISPHRGLSCPIPSVRVQNWTGRQQQDDRQLIIAVYENGKFTTKLLLFVLKRKFK